MSDKQNLNEFTNSGPAFQEILKGVVYQENQRHTDSSKRTETTRHMAYLMVGPSLEILIIMLNVMDEILWQRDTDWLNGLKIRNPPSAAYKRASHG